MLNSKSKNYVKYIAWISLVEFVLFVILTLYYIFFEENNSSILDLISKFGINKTKDLEADISHLDFIMKMISLLLTGIFVYIFFKNYRKISAEANIKQFILQILNFKKTVKYFIISSSFNLLNSTSVSSKSITFLFVSLSQIHMPVKTL